MSGEWRQEGGAEVRVEWDEGGCEAGAGCREHPCQDLEAPQPHRTTTMLLELVCCLLSARFLCAEENKAAVPAREESIISWRAGYSQK